MVCAQCAMMDNKMEKKLGDFVNVSLAMTMNKQTAIEQYKMISFSCFFAMGATAFRKNMLEQKGYFDETYKIIEDWSYYLSLTQSGSKIKYANFSALKHRDGGVSHFNQEVLPQHVIEYKNDSLLIQEKLILPHLKIFALHEKARLMERYECERKAFAQKFTDKKRPSRISIVKQNKVLFLRKLIWGLMKKIKKIRTNALLFVKCLLVAWVILRGAEIICAYVIPDCQFKLVGTPAYSIITEIVFVFLLLSIGVLLFLLLLSVVFYLRKKWKEFF
jgi:hypothetical protein